MKIADVYHTFFNAGEVTEIRAYGLSKTNKAWEGWAGGTGVVYGYFDNAEAFGRAGEALEQAKAPGIYFTLNPVKPDLLARAENRLKAASAKSSSTSDADIVCIRWIPVDLDPVRATGISSTAAELKKAYRIGENIIGWMSNDLSGLPGVVACSGNGMHILYRLPDLPNTDDSVNVVKGALAVLDSRFHHKDVEIDQKVFNPSRIWKLYGTTARKGDSTKTRPHRKSYIMLVNPIKRDV